MVTITEDVKVIKVGNSLRIAIPVVFRKALGIEEGNTLRLTSTNGDILVSPLQHREIRKKARNPFFHGPEKIAIRTWGIRAGPPPK